MSGQADASDSPPRYEFRLFGPDLGEQAGRLAATMDESGSRESRSLYVVWGQAEGINIKLSDHALDIKRLLRVTRGFEQWRPDPERRFPLDPAAIDGLPDLEQRGTRDAATFACRCRDAGGVLVHVRKLRRHFVLDGVLGETCRLLVNGCHVESIALESVDLARLAATCSHLGFDSKRNTSYPAMLKQITGMTPLPADSPHRAYPFG